MGYKKYDVCVNFYSKTAGITIENNIVRVPYNKKVFTKTAYDTKFARYVRDCVKDEFKKLEPIKINIKSVYNYTEYCKMRRAMALGDRSLLRRYFLYLLRWQLSTPIIAIIMSICSEDMGYIAATVLANFIGGVIFFWVDKWIFRRKPVK